MGGVVSDVVGGVGDVISGGVNIAGDMLKPAEKVFKWSTENPLEAAALAAGAYYAPALLGGASTGAAATGTGLTAGGTGLGLTGAGTTAYGGLGAGIGSTLGTEAALAGGLGGSAVGGLGLTAGGTALGGIGAGLGTSALAGGAGTAAGGLGLSNLGWGGALGAASLAAKALGGSQPTSSTTTTSIDPQIKEAYLRNLEEARATAAGLGPRQFAAFPQYNLGMVQQYMNPYQEEVVNNAMKDIERQRQIQTAAEGAQATASRAFGGSRQAVQRALVDEAALRQSGALGAQLRQQGFTQAQNLALQQEQLRQAYEQQKLDAARNLGLERLNVAQGALSLQPANLGGSTTTPIYRNQSASALGGALGGAQLGRLIGGTANPEYAGYGALAGGLLGFM